MDNRVCPGGTKLSINYQSIFAPTSLADFFKFCSKTFFLCFFFLQLLWLSVASLGNRECVEVQKALACNLKNKKS